jgi:uncharacterized HAD superfamily protein
MDGVLYDWDTQARLLLAEEFDAHVPGVTSSWFHLKDGVTKEQWRWLWNDEQAHRLYRWGAPYRGAVEMADELFVLADQLVIVTSAPEAARAAKMQWLSEHDIAYDAFVMTQQKSEARCDVYVDDSPNVALEIINNTGARVLLVDRPWNRDLARHHRITRVRDWEQLLLEVEVLK